MGNFEGGPRTCLKVGILKASRQGQRRYNSDADLGILDGVHIGASWRIRLNRPCAVTMQPYVRLLRPVIPAVTEFLPITLTFVFDLDSVKVN